MRRTQRTPRARRLYYAHALVLYGEPQEAHELRAIRRHFRGKTVVNPGKYQNHSEKRRDTMGFCFRLVEGCGVLVFSRLLDKVTAGVGKEVKHALKIGRPVFELTGDHQLVKRERPVKYLSRRATIDLYNEWRWRYRFPQH